MTKMPNLGRKDLQIRLEEESVGRVEVRSQKSRKGGNRPLHS